MSLEENLRLLEVIASMLAETVHRIRENAAERLALREENERLRTELGERSDVKNLLGRSPAMIRVKQMILQVAPSQATVLVRGASGTGKEIVARAIHQHSPRAAGPFLAVSCAALPESLVESELFGHEKGAFTGAQARRRGRFELATGGTLFLDEIGDLSPAMQVRLLRVLQERQFERVGGDTTLTVDVRVIAATNRPLEALIDAGQFREDLFYRLNVFPIFLPPLRERGSDVLLLADAFIEKYGRLHGRDGVQISPRALDLLMAHHWPGNVRELENTIERAVLLATENVIHPFHLPPSLQAQSAPPAGESLDSRVAQIETQILREALADADGNAVAAARTLQTTPRILRYRLRQLGIDPRQFRRRTATTAARRTP
jgi:Nif-specific regulatory protein